MFLKCAKRIFQHTYFVSSFGLMTGYLSGYLFRVPRLEDDGVIQYLRKQQMKRLTFSGGIWK